MIEDEKNQLVVVAAENLIKECYHNMCELGKISEETALKVMPPMQVEMIKALHSVGRVRGCFRILHAQTQAP